MLKLVSLVFVLTILSLAQVGTARARIEMAMRWKAEHPDG